MYEISQKHNVFIAQIAKEILLYYKCFVFTYFL